MASDTIITVQPEYEDGSVAYVGCPFKGDRNECVVLRNGPNFCPERKDGEDDMFDIFDIPRDCPLRGKDVIVTATFK